ncbi:hypothetical protein HELRODRAFT_161106 [Helobdella robusta]|uniref:EF-hand domain-containing protein n=1 Tax=Helobdella robusta TaxID=6412 RepID=T1ER37_HELRO|nr:hypothetical protein HELRODRAFT_161106 [Helobdella robusta]ESO01908.1 hypothetical protein HELRODRAFT_161106 [Helobdella robusta]
MANFRMGRRKSSVFRSGARLMSQEMDCRPLFTAMDRDCNGYIDRDELRATLWDVGIHVTDPDLDIMMKTVGVVIKDRIFYEDFVKMMAGTIGKSQRRVGKTFNILFVIRA